MNPSNLTLRGVALALAILALGSLLWSCIVAVAAGH